MAKRVGVGYRVNPHPIMSWLSPESREVGSNLGLGTPLGTSSQEAMALLQTDSSSVDGEPQSIASMEGGRRGAWVEVSKARSHPSTWLTGDSPCSAQKAQDQVQLQTQTLTLEKRE